MHTSLPASHFTRRHSRTVLTVLLAGFTLPIAAQSAPESAAVQPDQVNYMILVTGEELLRGVYPDSHTYFLTRTLRPLGCRCAGAMTVDDNREDLRRALQFTVNRAPLVIVTGGLGPTANDITRDTLSEFTGIALREDPDVLAEMERRFGRPRDALRENLRRQARVPASGTYLTNRHGSAVGLVFDTGKTVIVALPGPPGELQPMVTEELLPFLSRKFGVHALGATLTLRFVGVGQSQVDQVLRDHVPVDQDVFVSSVFEGSRVDFTFALRGNRPGDQARLKHIEEQIRRHLGDYFYADDDSTLEDCVARGLRARGNGLVLVEIGSAGHVAHNLSQAKPIPDLLLGAYVAPTERRMQALLRGATAAPSPPAAEDDRLKELGEQAKRGRKDTCALVVGEVRRSAAGRATCQVAFGFPDGEYAIRELGLRGSGEAAQANLTTQILDQWRRLLN